MSHALKRMGFMATRVFFCNCWCWFITFQELQQTVQQISPASSAAPKETISKESIRLALKQRNSKL